MLVGCGKKGEEAEPTASADPGAAAPVPKKTSPKVATQLSTVDQKLEKNEYDAAVAALMQAKTAAQTEADELAYRQQLYETQQKLLEKAETDPKARETYQALGRVVTGR